MRYFFILLLFVISFTSYCQEDRSLINEGAKKFDEQKFEAALTIFEKAFKKAPTCEAKFWIASCYFKMKKIPLAKSNFFEIIKSKCNGQEIPLSMTNLGSCYVDLKMPDSAFYYYNKTIKDFPSEADGAYFNKGSLLYSMSRFNEARQAYDSAIVLEPNNWFSYEKRLEVCFTLEDYECALYDLKKVHELRPDIKTETNLAFCFSMLKRYVEADSVFQLIYNEKDDLFLNNYGFNKYHLGDSQAGIELIKKAISINPKNSYAYRNLAIIAIDQKDNKTACEYLNIAKNLNFKKYYGDEVDRLLDTNCH